MPLNKPSPHSGSKPARAERSTVSKPLALALMTLTGLSPRQELMAETESRPGACKFRSAGPAKSVSGQAPVNGLSDPMAKQGLSLGRAHRPGDDRLNQRAQSGPQCGFLQTLNRNSITSPSCTTYSLPSERSQPRLRASAREPASSSCK